MITQLRLAHKDRILLFIAGFTGLTSIAAMLVADSPATTFCMMTAAIVPIALMRGVIAGDLRDGRWPLIFQTPLTATGYYSRLVGVILLTSVATVTLVGASAVAGADSASYVLQHLAAAIVLAIAIVAVSAAFATVTQQGETELFLLYVFLSGLQESIYDALGMPSFFREVFETVLFPFNPIFTLPAALGGRPATFDLRDLIVLIVYPLFWFAVAGYRLRVMNRGE